MGIEIGPEAFDYAQRYFTGNGCKGDATNNGITDMADLSMVLEEWAMVGQMAGDLNHDGVVNVDDLNEVLSAWMESCIP
ncbi:MAG: hypothetical protein KDA30_16085, partial [Phycisphaerales bacterium]|nr:hypothetical protein [Phycisphaerales bacterium]